MLSKLLCLPVRWWPPRLPEASRACMMQWPPLRRRIALSCELCPAGTQSSAQKAKPLHGLALSDAPSITCNIDEGDTQPQLEVWPPGSAHIPLPMSFAKYTLLDCK